MPTLLEQAIIDAQELRDAALRNAETTILEKYNAEVRNMVESLLDEQEEDEMGMGDEMEMGMEPEMPGDEGPTDGVADQVGFGAAAGQPMCPCPDDEATVTLNLDDLRAMSDELEGTEAMGEPMDQEDLAADLGIAPEGEEDEELDLAALSEGLDEKYELDEEETMEEEVELDEAELKELVEELIVDMAGTKSGYLNRPLAEINFEEELELARRSSTKYQEELETLRAAHDKISIQKESLVKKNNLLTETIYALKEKLEELNLSNAKLLYSNQALNSASLNERQKSKIVDSVQKADSVEEAKVIYETLQGAVGTSHKRAPKSLSEAVSRRPSTIIPKRRRERSRQEEIVRDRFKALAGIK
jgi:hypothetical protein